VTNIYHGLPFRNIGADAILRLAGSRGIAVIAPHPDDETLGCGALIARAARTSCRINVIALTDGDASHPGSHRWPASALAKLRTAELRRALARLGAGRARSFRLRARDGNVDETTALRKLRTCLSAVRPGVVLVTSAADNHPDHRAAAHLAWLAARPLAIPVIAYEVWARAETSRDQGGRYRAAKRWAMAAHRSQVSAYINDDPNGFRLSPSVLARLVNGPESFSCSLSR